MQYNKNIELRIKQQKEDIMKTNDFKSLRIQKGYTQEKLSVLLKVSKPSLSKKERGVVPFNLREISMLKQILGLTPKQIDRIFFDEKVVFKTTQCIKE